MNLYKDRNNLRDDYSGYKEVSRSLRIKLHYIIDANTSWNRPFGSLPNRNKIWGPNLKESVLLDMGDPDVLDIMLNGEYHDVFQVVEIFIKHVESDIPSRYRDIMHKLEVAFSTSGSVYEINNRIVQIRVDEETAEEVEKVMENLESKYKKELLKIFGDFIARKAKSKTAVIDTCVIFEKYIKEITHKKNKKESLTYLEKNGVIGVHQKNVIEKLYAFRGDADGVAHSGNTREPDEEEGFWFLRTLFIQIWYIQQKQNNKK